VFLESGRVCHLTCVDVWDPGGDSFPPGETMAWAERECRRRLARFGSYGGVSFLKLPSVEAASRCGGLDAVYIDGDHRYESVLADCRAWQPKVRPGGVFAGHDWWLPDVRRAVREVMGREPDEVYGDGSPEGTWVYRT
jgi:hypothetical protein